MQLELVTEFDTNDAQKESFLELARRFPERIVVLNALQTPEELAAEAMSVLDRVYGLSEDMKRAGL